MISAATSVTNSNASASGETSSSEDEHHTRKGRADDRRPRFYVEIPTRNQRPGKDRQRRASHLSSAASSVGKAASRPRTRGKEDRTGEPLARTVSFDGVDEGDQESSVLADDERVEASEEELEDNSRRPRMRTRRSSQVVPGGTVHALRSRAKAMKETAGDKHTPMRKGKGKAVVRNRTEEKDVEMEEVGSTEHEDSDGEFYYTGSDRGADVLVDPTPRTRTNTAPAISPTLKQANMRTRQARRQSLLSSVSSSKSFELSSLPSQYASSDEKESTHASTRSTSAGGMRRRTRGQARQHELENQLESMEITDEEAAEQEESVDQDMQDGDELSGIVSEAKSSVQDDDDDGDDEAEEFGEWILGLPLLLLISCAEHELTDATHTTLSRLRKARLMEMCEARELDTEGTKKDLIQFLLEWVSTSVLCTGSR